MWAGFAAYLAALFAAPALGRRVVWAAIAVLVAGFALVPPLLSHDVYSYVDYARLGAVHGIDPYVRGPAAAPADPAFAHVTWPHTTSAYGPLFTLATYPLALLPVSTAVWALKVVAGASVLGLAAICARLAPLRGVDPLRAAAFVALNPLVLVHVVGGGHNDALAMLLAMLGVAAVLLSAEISASRRLRRSAGGQGLDRLRRPLRSAGRAAAGAVPAQRGACPGSTGRGLPPRLRLALAARDRARRREPVEDEPPQHPLHCRPAHRPRQGAGPYRRPRPLRRRWSATCSPGPGAAATGCAPPPGPPSASSSPPPGSSPGT